MATKSKENLLITAMLKGSGEAVNHLEKAGKCLAKAVRKQINNTSYDEDQISNAIDEYMSNSCGDDITSFFWEKFQEELLKK